jgi:hypothetical protein
VTINEAINQRITRRAERVDACTLPETFVAVGGVDNILFNPVNRILSAGAVLERHARYVTFGRRQAIAELPRFTRIFGRLALIHRYTQMRLGPSEKG